ncbi:MAG: SOS response-associated peptidase [Acidobacteriota bacterium]
MCGRFTQASPGETIAELFALDDVPRLARRFNIAPTQSVSVVRARAGGGRELVEMRWGLIPAWAKEVSIGSRLINARAETVADKPAFRAALRHRRCLVVADGFYEWRRLENRKQPYHIRMADGRPFAFAGLWERWTPMNGEPVESCAIVTTEPNELLRPIHDRMPVILEPGEFGRWIDASVENVGAVVSLLRPYQDLAMIAYPVSPRVNNPANDDPDCITRIP